MSETYEATVDQLRALLTAEVDWSYSSLGKLIWLAEKLCSEYELARQHEGEWARAHFDIQNELREAEEDLRYAERQIEKLRGAAAVQSGAT